MVKPSAPAVEMSANLLDAIHTFPLQRTVEHCGRQWTVSPFDIYTNCPHCSARIKLRSFSGCGEIEDVFDSVFEWLTRPGAEQLLRQRQ